jgi:L-aspartate oxidase
MADYHPLKELAPRDIVSRAITDQMEKTRHSCVYLDLKHIPEAKVIARFPHIRKVCQEFGLDLARDPIPVRPGAHYMIGGLTVDLEGRTSLPNLWAAGEVTSTGLHGANRLASNSLLEGLYYGVRCGRGASQAALSIPDNFCITPLASQAPAAAGEMTDELNLVDLRNSLASLMGRYVGIRRDKEGLAAAAEQVEFWDRYVSLREFSTVQGWELQNMLLVAKLMIQSAMARQESRGVHFRSDFPQPVFEPQTHVVTHRGDA